MGTIQDQIQALLDEGTSKGKIPGVILYAADRKGNELFHGSSGPLQAGSSTPLSKDSYCWIASCTKLITAIACLQLVEQGRVSLDDADQMGKILPELLNSVVYDHAFDPNQDFAAAAAPKTRPLKKRAAPTLRQLLTHTAGQNYPFFNRGAKAWCDANGIPQPFASKKACVELPLSYEPGEHWEYSSSIDWAGQVVERVSGKTLDAYFKENIFGPVGVQGPTFLPEASGVTKKLALMNFRKPDGEVVAGEHAIELRDKEIEFQYGGAGLFANCKDYVQVLVALVNGGKHPRTGGQILSEASIKELTRPQLNEAQASDLDRTIPAAMPELTNEITPMPGAPKQWAIGGHKILDGIPAIGRSGNSIWWCGIANNYWFADFDHGLAAMIQTQLFPFNDADVIGTFAQAEAILQKSVAKDAKCS